MKKINIEKVIYTIFIVAGILIAILGIVTGIKYGTHTN